MRRGFGILAVGALVAAGGCKPEVTAQDINTRSSAIVQNTVVNSTKALGTLSSQSTMTALSSALANLDAVLAGMPALPGASTATTALASKATRRLAARPAVTCADGTTDCESTQSPEDTAAEINDWLETNVFTKDNLESSDDTSATFLLKGAPFCETTTCSYTCTATGCTDGGCVTAVDPECVRIFEEIEVRIRATPVGDDGVKLELLIGPDRYGPVTLDASSTSLAVTVDLAAVKSSYLRIAGVAGVQDVELPAVMAGRVKGELRINGDQDVSLTGSVLEAVQIVVTSLEGDTGLSLGAADPMVSLRVQGLTGAVSMALAAGALDVYEPWSTLTGNLLSTGRYEMHLDGASFAATILPGATDLTVTDIGLGDGPTTLAKDGVPFVTIDLNALEGRKLDLTVSPDTAANSATFAVTPAFDLGLGFAYGPVAADFPAVPTWAYDETLRFALTGDGAAVEPLAADTLTGFPGGIAVRGGTLVLSAASGASLEVPAGSCLVSQSYVAPDAHPVIGAFAVVTCP